MGATPLEFKLIMGTILMTYTIFLFRNRHDFNIPTNVVVSSVVFSFALCSILSLVEKNGMHLGYTGLFFSTLSFGWIGGVAGAFGIALSQYSQGASIGTAAICVVLCSLAGVISGITAKRGSDFSTLLVSSVLGALTILGGNLLSAQRSLTSNKVTPTLDPLLVSLVTGVIIGTGAAFYVKKCERWPEPVERKR